MTIFNLGSACIDHVYQVPYFVTPGETLPCTHYEVHPGGKGLNQSLALARAGADVVHGGLVGPDGQWLVELLEKAGVNTQLLGTSKTYTGQALIQVTPDGENAIVINGGANQEITEELVNQVLEQMGEGDFLLLQNELNEPASILAAASKRGCRVALNAAPITDAIIRAPLDNVDYLIVNETEANALAGTTNSEEALSSLSDTYPRAGIVLTLGERGVVYADRNGQLFQAGFQVDAVDMTGAGDTFTGYFLAAVCKGQEMAVALETACLAAAVSVTRAGAASSIPTTEEVAEFRRSCA